MRQTVGTELGMAIIMKPFIPHLFKGRKQLRNRDQLNTAQVEETVPMTLWLQRV